MADRAEKSRRDHREPHPLAVLAGVLAAFLLLAACYVGYQALHILFPQNVYETALPATVSDNVEADGVLLFDEVYVSGSGTLGYLAADGERVSAGTAVAEIYSDASQAVLRQQLTQLTEQIDLLQRSQNTTSLQLDALLRERSAALYDMMDELDAGAYDEVSSGANAYLLAQNKLWIATGDSANFTDQVTALTQQAQSVQAQLAAPPRSPPRRPATLSGRPAAGGSMPEPTTSLHRTRLSSRRIWILTPPCRWTVVPARSFPASPGAMWRVFGRTGPEAAGAERQAAEFQCADPLPRPGGQILQSHRFGGDH